MIIDFTFTAISRPKIAAKMSAIYEFDRVMAVANEDGSIVEGNHDFVKVSVVGRFRTGSQVEQATCLMNPLPPFPRCHRR